MFRGFGFRGLGFRGINNRKKLSYTAGAENLGNDLPSSSVSDDTQT